MTRHDPLFVRPRPFVCPTGPAPFRPVTLVDRAHDPAFEVTFEGCDVPMDRMACGLAGGIRRDAAQLLLPVRRAPVGRSGPALNFSQARANDRLDEFDRPGI